MARKTIANIGAILTANATNFIEAFKRADNVARRTIASIRKTLSKPVANLSLGFFTATSAASLLSREIGGVVRNVESINGLPPEVVESVQLLRYQLGRLNLDTESSLAKSIAGWSQLGHEAAKAYIEITQGSDAAESAMTRWRKESEIAAKNRPEAFAAMAAAVEKLAEADKALNFAGASRGEKLAADLAQAQAAFEQIEANRKPSMDDTVADVEKRADAMLRLARARGSVAAFAAEHAKAESDAAKALQSAVGATVPLKDQADALGAAIANIQVELAKLDDMSDPKVLEARIDLYRRMADHGRELKSVTDEQRRAAQEVGAAFENSFEDAIFSGEKFGDVLKNLGATLLRMALMRSIISPLADKIGGGVSGVFRGIMGFANGGRPAPGVPAIVGERGPELFVPDTAGRVIPAERTASMLGGGSGGETKIFQIDARGADTTAVARLEMLIRQLNGSIEHRAVAAVYDAGRRGGALGRML